MSVTAAQLTAKVSAEGVSETKSALADVGASVTSTGGIFKNALGGALSLATGIAGQGLNFLKDQFVDSIKVAMDHQQVMAQTAQVVKSTGGVAGMTAQSIDDLAMSLSHTTEFSHDAVQGGENLLMTFTGIGKDVFPQATKTMLDMAQAMGGDMKGTAIQLGKALNDPATGLTALTRVGVTFTDSQKQMIQQMVASGDTVGAQKVMLAELQKEFGGSAEAAGKTLPGALAILKNNFQDIKEKIGTAVIPILANMASFVSANVLPALERFGEWFSANLGPALARIGDFIQPVIHGFSQLGNTATPVGQSFEYIGGILRYVGSQFNYLFGTVESIGLNVFHALQDSLGGTGKSVESGFLRSFGKIGPIIGQVGDVVHEFTSKLGSIDFYGITQGVVQFAQSLGTQFGPILQNIAGLLSGQFSTVLKDVGKDAQQVGGWFMSSVVPAIKQVLPPFEDLAKTLLGTLMPAMIQVRGIVIDVAQHAFEKFAPIIERIVPPAIQFAGVMAGALSNAIKFITPYIVSAAKEVGVFASGLADRLAPIATNVFNMISTAVGGFSKFWAAIWPTVSAILKGVWDEIRGIIQIAWAIVSGIINIGLDILGGNWGKAWDDMKSMFSGIWEGIKTYLSGAWEIIKGMFGKAWEFIKGVFAGVGGWFHDRWDDIVHVFSNVGGWFHDRFQDAWNAITGVFNGASTWFHDHIWQPIADGLGNAFSGVADTVSGAFDNIKGAVKWSINGVIDMVNGIINNINNVSSKVGVSLPNIPKLASGTSWFPGGMALVGEVGPELVNLPRGSQVIPNDQIGSYLPTGTQAIPMSFSQTQQPQIIVQSPVYLDGRLLSNGLLPYMVDGIRYRAGIHGM